MPLSSLLTLQVEKCNVKEKFIHLKFNSMRKLIVLKITSSDINIYIPREANFNYIGDIEKIKERLLNGRFSEFVKSLEITEEEIAIPHSDFSERIFKCLNLDILCYQGFGYPRYFKGRKIFYSCWEIYEFGGWGPNENHFYNRNGELEEIENY